jgi:short-subunit dehydrogenase
MQESRIDKDNSSLDDFSIVRKTLDVNVGGVLNTVEPLIGRLMARKAGQIAVVLVPGRLRRPALFRLVQCPAKAAVRVWGESIRYVLKKSGVGVSVICPGFVVSRITAQAPFRMPFLMSPERASKIIREGLARNKARIAFPVPTKAAVWFGAAAPWQLDAKLLGA